MKNSFLNFILLFIICFPITFCTNPFNDISDFKMGIDAGKLLDPAVKVSFGIIGENNSVPENIIVRIEGEGAQSLTDVNGENFFNVGQDGILNLLLQPGITPDNNNPLMIKIIAEAKGCLPVTEEIYLFGRDKNPDIKLNFYRATNPPPGYKVEEQMALFAGKKAADTLVFQHRDLNGVDFTFKYPVQGAVFVVNRYIQYIVEEKTVNIEVEEDSIVGAAYYYKKQLLSPVVKVKRLKPVQRITYGNKVIPDTIPVENVKARIWSNTNPYLETSGFKDAEGRDIELPRLFTGVVRVPRIDFISSNGEYITVMYPGDFNKGRLITAKLTDPNVSLFLSGTFYSGDKESEYISGNSVIPNSKLKFNNDNSITFKDDYVFDKEFFFFKDMLVGCGFVNVVVRPSFNLIGFDIDYGITHGIIQYNRYGVYDEPIRLPSFTELGDAELYVKVNHYYNQCFLKEPPLFEKTQTLTPCNYVGGSYNYFIDYNPSLFWQKYRSLFSQVNVTASVLCRLGNRVTLPEQTIGYEILNDPCTKRYFNISNSKVEVLLVKNKTYVLSFYNKYNNRTIIDTMSINQTDKDFIGFIDGPTGSFRAYTGKMLYNPATEEYNLNAVFEQPYFKHFIPGCGN